MEYPQCPVFWAFQRVCVTAAWEQVFQLVSTAFIFSLYIFKAPLVLHSAPRVVWSRGALAGAAPWCVPGLNSGGKVSVCRQTCASYSLLSIQQASCMRASPSSEVREEQGLIKLSEVGVTVLKATPTAGKEVVVTPEFSAGPCPHLSSCTWGFISYSCSLPPLSPLQMNPGILTQNLGCPSTCIHLQIPCSVCAIFDVNTTSSVATTSRL